MNSQTVEQILQSLYAHGASLAAFYLPKAIGAIVVLLIGLRLIRFATNSFGRVLDRQALDPSLRSFLSSLLNATLKVLLVISVASMVGIATTSFVAVLGAMGLAIGLSLQGSLSNFAGGVLILVFRPFKVGDYIEAQGFAGTVKEVQIFTTILNTPDNKRIIIPNGNLANNPMVNYSAEEKRRVDFKFGISYDDDIQLAKKLLVDIAQADSRILSEPAMPFVGVLEYADSSVNLCARFWVNAKDYWDVYFQVHEQVKDSFDRNKISIPFPQTEIHVKSKENMPLQ